MDLDAHAAEQAPRRLGDPFRQSGQNTFRGLNQHDADVALRVDAVEPVADHFARGAVQFGSQLGTRRAGTYDGHVKLAGTYRTVLHLSANAGIHQTTIK